MRRWLARHESRLFFVAQLKILDTPRWQEVLLLPHTPALSLFHLLFFYVQLTLQANVLEGREPTFVFLVLARPPKPFTPS